MSQSQAGKGSLSSMELGFSEASVSGTKAGSRNQKKPMQARQNNSPGGTGGRNQSLNNLEGEAGEKATSSVLSRASKWTMNWRNKSKTLNSQKTDEMLDGDNVSELPPAKGARPNRDSVGTKGSRFRGSKKRGGTQPRSNYLDDAVREHEESGDEIMRHMASLETNEIRGAIKIETRYGEPTKDIIQDFVKTKHLRNQETGKKFGLCSTKVGYKICGKDRPSDENTGTYAVQRLGPGVTSYFSFLMIYGLAFIFFGIVTSPVMFFNRVVGGTLDGIPSYSIGNLLQTDDLVNAGNLSPDYTFSFQSQVITIARDVVAFVDVFADIIVIIMFLILAEYCMVLFQKKEYRWDLAHPKIEHFTVEVSNLPDGANFNSIKDHFENVIIKVVNPKRAAKFSDRSKIRKRLEDPNSSLNQGRAVDDVQIVSRTKDNLARAIKLATLSKDAAKKEALLVKANEKKGASKISELRFQLIVRAYNEAKSKLKKVYEQEVLDLNSNEKIIKAFVTFSSLSYTNGILEEYKVKKRKNPCSKLISQADEDLDMDGQKLTVVPAAPPSLVKWEHIEYKWSSRIWRSSLSLVAVFVVLLISAISTFLFTKVESLEVFSVLNDEQLAAIDVKVFSCDDFDVSGTKDSPECADVTELNGDSNLDCVKAFSCFCDLKDPDTITDPVCKQLLIENLVESAFLAGTGIIVMLFNIVLEVLISWSVTFEKDEDRAKEEKKLFLRLFISSYINTALVSLIADFNLEKLFGINFGVFSAGDFDDFTADWYGQVGYDIVIIAISNIFGPHVWSFLEYYYSKLRRSCFKPLSIDDIEIKYLGPAFILPLRYAQVLVTIYFTMTFSSGIPLLYPIAAASMFLTFWVDKFFLLHFYAKPPLYTNDIVILTCRGMKYAAFVHAAFGVMMLSQPTLFPFSSASTDLLAAATDGISNFANETDNLLASEAGQRLSAVPVVFLFIVAALLALFIIISQIHGLSTFIKNGIWKCFKTILKPLKCIPCCRKSNSSDPQKMNQDVDSVAGGRDAKLERDAMPSDSITSYNILANPLYADRFKLTSNQTFEDLKRANQQIHSISEVLELLDDGAAREEAERLLRTPEDDQPLSFWRWWNKKQEENKNEEAAQENLV